MNANLEKQIEAAYDYRGHVTVTLTGGERVEGYLFNRQLAPKGAEPYVELYLKGSGDYRKLAVAEVASVALTGEDFAAGNSYEDYLKKKKAGQ